MRMWVNFFFDLLKKKSRNSIQVELKSEYDSTVCCWRTVNALKKQNLGPFANVNIRSPHYKYNAFQTKNSTDNQKRENSRKKSRQAVLQLNIQS